jgi:hypothetical protein
MTLLGRTDCFELTLVLITRDFPQVINTHVTDDEKQGIAVMIP